MRTKNKFQFKVVFTLIAMLMVSSFPAGATHAWGDYHWSRNSNPFTLSVIDKMTPDWDSVFNA